MLSDRSEEKRLSSLEQQVLELDNVATTMKRYLEEIVGISVEGRGGDIIAEEEERLKQRRIENELQTLSFIEGLLKREVPMQEAMQIFTDATSLDDLSRRMKEAGGDKIKSSAAEMVEHWHEEEDWLEEINQIRNILGSEPFGFESTGKG
jgi:hypothetical protein